MSTPTPLRLDLRHYETVVAIVDFGTMTRAAQHLTIGQSALSHRLAEAEKRLGMPLFIRGTNRRLSPNPQGLAVYQAASRAIGDLRRLEEALAVSPSGAEITLRIGVGAYDTYHWFPGYLATLREDRPDLDLDLVSITDPVGAAVAGRTVDMALAPGYPEGEHTLIPAFDDELVFICAPDHRLAGREVIAAADLADETLLTYNALPTPGFEYDRFVRPSGYSPRLVRVVPQTAAIVELVAAGAGVSILSRWATNPMVEAGRLARARCKRDGLSIPWHITVRPNEAIATEVAHHLGRYLDAGIAAGA